VPEGRQGFEAKRGWGLGQQDGRHGVLLAPALELDVGDRAQVGELAPALGQEVDRPVRLGTDRAPRRRQSPCTTSDEEEAEEGDDATG
jgi:hypothetical protein